MPKRQELNSPAIVVLLPSRGRLTVETLAAMGHLDTDHINEPKPLIVTAAHKSIVEARNELAKTALEVPAQASFVPKVGWHALWEPHPLRLFLDSTQVRGAYAPVAQRLFNVTWNVRTRLKRYKRASRWPSGTDL